jgi:hypothetical protein
MQHNKDKTTDSRPSATASSAVSISTTNHEQHQLHHPSHRTLKHKQILKGTEICSRFDQMSGHSLPKRMTTGKFVYLGPSDTTPDSPL